MKWLNWRWLAGAAFIHAVVWPVNAVAHTNLSEASRLLFENNLVTKFSFATGRVFENVVILGSAPNEQSLYALFYSPDRFPRDKNGPCVEVLAGTKDSRVIYCGFGVSEIGGKVVDASLPVRICDYFSCWGLPRVLPLHLIGHRVVAGVRFNGLNSDIGPQLAFGGFRGDSYGLIGGSGGDEGRDRSGSSHQQGHGKGSYFSDRCVKLECRPVGLFLSRLGHSPLLAQIAFFGGLGGIAQGLLLAGVGFLLFGRGRRWLYGLSLFGGGTLAWGGAFWVISLS